MAERRGPLQRGHRRLSLYDRADHDIWDEEETSASGRHPLRNCQHLRRPRSLVPDRTTNGYRSKAPGSRLAIVAYLAPRPLNS